MKFMSELTSKVYDTLEECEEADKAYVEEQKAAEERAKQLEAEENAKKAALTKIKKELADAVTDADNNLNKALEDYDSARNTAAEMLEKSNKEVSELLNEAKKNVEAARKAKQQALLEFNRKFGPFKVSYTGEKAKQEYQRMRKELDFNSIFSSLFNSLFI